MLKFRGTGLWKDPWYSSQTILYIGSFSCRMEVLSKSIVIYQRDFILTWPRIPHYANPKLSEQHGFGNTREALSKLPTTLALNQVQSVSKYTLSLATLRKGKTRFCDITHIWINTSQLKFSRCNDWFTDEDINIGIFGSQGIGGTFTFGLNHLRPCLESSCNFRNC